MKLCTVCGVATSRPGSRCTEHARQPNRSRRNALYGDAGHRRPLATEGLRRIVRFLRDLRASWDTGGEWERAKLVASVYDRVVVNYRAIVEVDLTEDAKHHGLALALPERLKVVMARPAGLEPTAFCSGGRRSIH
jgi:hypothetical protein